MENGPGYVRPRADTKRPDRRCRWYPGQGWGGGAGEDGVDLVADEVLGERPLRLLT